MADKESTSPPAAAAFGSSPPVTPAAKRVRTTSPPKETAQTTTETVPAQRDGNTTSDYTTVNTTRSTVGEDHVEGFDDVDDQESLHDGDSAFGTDNSDTTSVTSSIYAGYVENGRRYQTLREGEYWGPSDEKQFENMDAVHIVHRILDHAQKNPLFHSPIPKSAQNILDLGTGNGVWARDVADMFPSTVVYGIDLSPPPDEWVPPNCKFEVDDALKRWMFPQKMDLIHMRQVHRKFIQEISPLTGNDRWLMGSFTRSQWSNNIYQQAYENLLPGGWIEQVEPSIVYTCDDGSLPEDSYLAGWGHMFCRIAERIGKPLNTVDTFKAAIQDAGFINVHEKAYKVPVGEWTKNPVLREAGKFNKTQLLAGMEGYAMYLLTKFGEPEPWSPQEVQVYLAKVRNDINNPKHHAYQVFRRVWAQKPLNAGSAAQEAEPAAETAA